MPDHLRIQAALDPAILDESGHVLVVFPSAKALPRDLPGAKVLRRVLDRRGDKPADLAKGAVTEGTPGGGLWSWLMLDPAKPRFELLTALRKAITPLLDEHPKALAIAIVGEAAFAEAVGPAAAYAALVNAATLPTQKSKGKEGGKGGPKPSPRITVAGWECAPGEASDIAAVAAGNVLARTLTVLPPNALTPAEYRRRIQALAAENGWQAEEFDFKRLRRMGAGAFVAVAQGSHQGDAAIVRLSYAPKRATGRVALVGKGICFDTGGHNLKPARYMAGMHEDMAGSAVALGILLAATRQKLPLRIDAWLAIAENHLSPQAYKQGDIVTALDGTTIEVVHTDAEGRMVLADTLTLASRGDDKGGKGGRPDLVVDFATLTGSMVAALGNRYSGVFATSSELAHAAGAAGRAAGERVCTFPLDEDYEADLESKVADIKQCTLEGDADHILAARFLKRFTGGLPWLHVDLSAAGCKGGLGAVGTDATGFGVAWGVELLRRMAAKD